jgi:hypothetical protein
MRAALALLASLAAAPSGPSVAVSGFPIVCGRPLGTVKISFPAPVRLPARIAPAAIRLNGLAPAHVGVAGRTMTIVLPRREGVMCHSILLGPLTIRFSAAAHVQTGAARTAMVTHGARRYRATITA